MTSKIFAVGAGSFIAQNWKALAGDRLHAVPHDQLANDSARECGSIVNFAMSPAFKMQPYSEKDDLDLATARRAADLEKHFVMLSTRKVYQPESHPICLSETSRLGPVDYYGANKLESERRITSLLGERCTILRIGNVFGYELGRRSFFGMAMTRLKEQQRIVLDVSPFVERDFIAVSVFATLLDRICSAPLSGIYNVGAGIGLPLGRIAQWLIQGYGSGTLEITAVDERDGFIMDTRKLRQTFAIAETLHDFESGIRNLGKQLN